jgi:hypothetical protein
VQQNKTLVAILPSPFIHLDEKGFYPEFYGLSRLNIEGLWLTRLMIDRGVPVVRIEGAMNSSNKLNDFLTFLGQSSAFSQDRFVGLKVETGLLPAIPYEYREKIAALKLPPFYRFIAQTSPIKDDKENKNP